ncbi:MAG: glycosyltransferase family 4 protein, partial [Aestuariivirga sp.]
MRETKPAPFSVIVATPLGKGGEGGIDRLMDGVRASGLLEQQENLNLLFGTTRGRGSIWFSPFYLASFIMQLLWQRAIGRCDLVHINLASDGSTYRKTLVAKTAKALGIPYVLHLHGADYEEFLAAAKPALRYSIEAMFASADRVIVLGQVWRKFIIECLPVAPERVVIIPNAVPIPKLPQKRDNSKQVRILFLGRIGARKGVPTLLEALSMIADRSDWRAAIAGDGEIAETKSELQHRNLSARVEVPGWLGSEETELRLANADILVLPSRNENLPMSVIEAMAAGLAIVTTPVGATAEIIKHDETGLLIAVDDADGLAKALSRLIGDVKLRQRLGKAAQQFHRKN